MIGRSGEQGGDSGYVRCSPDLPLSPSLVVLHLIFLSLRCFLFARSRDHPINRFCRSPDVRTTCAARGVTSLI
jgi:hypothetical protein